MSTGKRTVRRVLVMIDYGDGEAANGEVFDLTALALEMLPHAKYGHADIGLDIVAESYYPSTKENPLIHIKFNGDAGERVYGALHLDDVVNAALPEGIRVQEIRKKITRLDKKRRDLEHDVMVAKLRQASEIRSTHPIARFHEPLPPLPPPAAPALAEAVAQNGGAT